MYANKRSELRRNHHSLLDSSTVKKLLKYSHIAPFRLFPFPRKYLLTSNFSLLPRSYPPLDHIFMRFALEKKNACADLMESFKQRACESCVHSETLTLFSEFPSFQIAPRILLSWISDLNIHSSRSNIVLLATYIF